MYQLYLFQRIFFIILQSSYSEDIRVRSITCNKKVNSLTNIYDLPIFSITSKSLIVEGAVYGGCELFVC